MHFPFARAQCALLSAVLAACGQAPAHRPARAPDVAERPSGPTALEHEIPFLLVEGLVVVPLHLDGIERTLYFALDTGAPTVLREELALELKPARGEKTRFHDSAGRELDVVPLQLPGVRVAGLHVEDVAAVVAPLPAPTWLCHRLDGILGVGLSAGSGFLDRVAVQIDYEHERIAFAESGASLAQGGIRLTLGRSNYDDDGAATLTTSSKVQAVVEGKTGWVTLDTGNSGDTAIGVGLFERLGRSLDEPGLVRVEGVHSVTAGGTNIGTTYLGRLRSLELGGVQLPDIPLAIEPQTASGFETLLLGHAFLANFTVIVDHPGGEARLIARAGAEPSQVDATLGFGWLDVGDRVAVVALVAGGPADRAGILLGDELRELDGVVLVPGDTKGQCALRRRLQAPLDRSIALQLRRDDRAIDLRLTAAQVLPLAVAGR